jgi:hypothetical protein
MLKIGKWLCLLLVAAASLQELYAGVDFSGEWVMNPNKSSYRPKPQPQAETYSIEHKYPAITVRFRTTWSTGPSSGSFFYTADGKEISGHKKLDNGREADMTESVQWDGPALVVKRKIKFAELPLVITVETERWSISADNRVLTITTEMSSERPDGKPFLTMTEHPTVVYDRVR